MAPLAGPAARAGTYEWTCTFSLLLVVLLGASGGLQFGCADTPRPLPFQVECSCVQDFILHLPYRCRVVVFDLDANTALAAPAMREL